jgi:hypothetical protein
VAAASPAGWLVAFGLASGLASGACGDRVTETLRTVSMHVPAACPVDGGAYAEYYAQGDFDPATTRAQPPGHFLRDVGVALPEIDPAARELLVTAGEGDRLWIGLASVPPSGDVDVLLLPSLASCPLNGDLAPRVGSTLAPVSAERFLLLGGDPAGDAGSGVPPTYVVSLATGHIDLASPDLRTPRPHGASVTAFAGGAVVAGGVRDGAVLDTAEIFDATLGGFDQSKPPILLSGPRAEHGAVVLATGETLLVGGVGEDGKTPVKTLEIVDPVTRTVRAESVEPLTAARRNPSVMRLASGQILVAGGTDASGPVTLLEWFAPDASAHVKQCTADLVAGSARSFVALPAGGALAVVAPPAGAPPGFQNTWVIDADCAVEPAAPVQGSLVQPVLFGAAGGAPALWTGDRWLRWAPWSAAFVALDVLDDVPSHLGDAWAAPDPGLAVWLDAMTSSVFALRFDNRGEYSPLPSSILVADATETAPDRRASPGVVAFDTTLGGLVLAPGASAFVTDRSYADVAIDVDAPTGEPALVVLRDAAGNELEVGGVSCAGAVAAGETSLHVERRGRAVTWSIAGGAAGACAGTVAAGARVAVGLRGAPSASRSVAKALRVARLGPE